MHLSSIVHIFCLIFMFIGLLVALSAISSIGWFMIGTGFLSIVVFSNIFIVLAPFIHELLS